jgi:hypothetical protein
VKHFVTSLVTLAAAAAMSAPALAITCPAGSHPVMSKGANPHLICSASTMMMKKKATPKPMPKPMPTKKP